MPFNIDAQIEEWKKSLLDTSKRNRLIKFTTGRGGGISLLHPAADAVWQRLVVDGGAMSFPWKRDLLGLPAELIDDEAPSSTVLDASDEAIPSASPTITSEVRPEKSINPGQVRLPKTIKDLTSDCMDSPRLGAAHLLTEFTDKKLAGHLLRLSRTASEAETEHGVSTLYAAFGFLRWYESQESQIAILSPLVLVPVRLARESIEAAWTLRAGDDDPATNHCLAHLLAADFHLRLPNSLGTEIAIAQSGLSGADLVGDLTEEVDAEVSSSSSTALTDYLKRVAALVASIPRWEVVKEVALGVFNFQKLAMWEDLTKNAERIMAHELCRAIAGDTSAMVGPPPGLLEAKDLDEEIPPAAVTHILDADSSQHEAIEAIKRGANVVIDGPPGTGKSQTIANVIAELLASGKTALFVSEKTAALHVVSRRLKERGLGDFCLELHSNKASKQEVAKELGKCLGLGREPAPDLSAELQRLADHRRHLNSYVVELHRLRLPLGKSAFQVHGELARLANLLGQTRWSVPDIFNHNDQFLSRATDILASLVRCKSVVENPERHPWRGCLMTGITQAGQDDARHHLTRLASGAKRLAVGTTLADLRLEGPTDSFDQWQRAAGHARSVLAVPQVPVRWFEGDPIAAASAMLRLHAASVRSQALSLTLGGFNEEAVGRLTKEVAEELASGLARRRELLAGGHALSARSRIGALRDLATRLKAIDLALGPYAEAFQRLLSTLQISAQNVPPGKALNYARVAGKLAVGKPVTKTWWDAGRRSELIALAERASKHQAAANALRNELIARLSPAAFTPEAGPLVREALNLGRSVWRFIKFLHWGNLLRKILAWYPIRPDRETLFADLINLDKFHGRADYLRQVEASNLGDVVLTPAGRADWPATVEGLRAVNHYDKWKLPSKLKDALAPGGGLDRAALGAAAKQMIAAESAWKSAWGRLLTTYVPTDSFDQDSPPHKLTSRLRMEAEEAENEAKALESLVKMLHEKQDLPPHTWETRSAELAEFVRLRVEIATHAASLGIDGSVSSIQANDWSSLASAAGPLRRFLAHMGRRPSTATIAALSNNETRKQLQTAVEVCDQIVQAGFEESWEYTAGTLFPPAMSVSEGLVLTQTSIPELARWASSQLADLHRLEEWVRYCNVRRDAANLGIETVVEEACAGLIKLDLVVDIFRRRFLGLWLDALYQKVPVLAKFSAEEHDELIDRFAQLDRLSVSTAGKRLRSHLLAQPQRPRADGTAPATSELGVLLREVNKKRKHMSLRQLLAQIPTLLLRLKPCLMMSPLAVSTYLGSSDMKFDVVVFDEASQVRPHDAICAVYRGRQLVVAGDPKQLPPSNFFVRASIDDPEDEEAEGTGGFESLLDVSLSLNLVRKRLRWHYRSRREGLIAFSNKYFYDGDLVTFPSVDDAGDRAVQFERVPNGVFENGVNVSEANRTAQLVIKHFMATPKRSLGVIAFSQGQQNRILDELEVLRKANPTLEEFFKEDSEERFFVKNLENVQGDERDVILLSVGYGPDLTGKVPLRFGPLNQAGGERRLNVAVTRARQGMIVVASMVGVDIDLTRTKAKGVSLLRSFLEYAERGPAALVGSVTGAKANEFDSPFEKEVFEELGRRGLSLHTQIGCGGYRIDMAVVDPNASGRYLLGVECDGAAYHSSATARDRDRLRQAVLEGLGWHLCRIWSTDWLRNREKQVKRVFTALDKSKLPSAHAPEEVVIPPPVSEIAEADVPPDPTAVVAKLYPSIGDVPDFVIRRTALDLLSEFGATEIEDLCKAITRKLGFLRMGAKIRDRLKDTLSALARERKLESLDNGRLGLPSSAVG